MAKFRSTNGTAPRSGPEELDGLFSGLGDVLKAAADLVDKSGGTELSRARAIGNPHGMRGMYGFSVRIGPARRPNFRKAVTLRQEPTAQAENDPREPPVDLFDEGDHYVIVAEFVGVEDPGIQWRVKGKMLIIEAKAEDRHYYKEVELRSLVDQQTGTAACKNGILELKLWKQ